MEPWFWAGLFGAVYSYVLYPALLWVIVRGRDSGEGLVPVTAWLPLSILITARNEAGRIEAKLRDVLSQDYSGELEVVVVSDASTDATDALVGSFPDARVRLVRQEDRLGKEAGQARGIGEAKGEILVFTDVATRIQPGSLQAICSRLADPAVGAVSSEDRFEAADGRLVGEGLYVRYEMWLRRLESRAAGLVGLSGSFFAVGRQIVREDWRTDVPSDFTVALTCARKGLKAVSDPAVIGIYPDLKEPADEYARKRRTVVRGMAGMAAARQVLNPFRYGLFAWQAWSHKVLRWAVPWFLLLLFISSLALAGQGPLYLAALIAQLAGYGLALLGWVSRAARTNGLVRLAFYFCQVNLAMADALLRFLKRNRVRLMYCSDWGTISWRYLAYRLSGVRTIIVHDHAPGLRTPPTRAKRLLKQFINRLPGLAVDGALGATEFVRQRLVNVTGFPADKCFAVPNGLPAAAADSREALDLREEFNIPPDRRILVMTGRASRYKRVDFAIRCLSAIISRGRHDLHFLFVGDGPDLGFFKKTAERLGVSGYCTFAGRRDDVNPILPGCDFAIHPSSGEVGYSLSILEYMQSGLAVVVPDNPSVCGAIVHAETGLVYREGDLESAVDCICRLLDAPGFVRRLGESARETMNRDYRLEATHKALLAAFEHLDPAWPKGCAQAG